MKKKIVLLLTTAMLAAFSGSYALAEEAVVEEDVILEEDIAAVADEAGTAEDAGAVEAGEDAAVTEESDAAVTEETDAGTEAQANDGISVVSVEEVESDAQTISTDSETELGVNTTYYISDILNTTQYFTVSGAGRVQFILENCTYPSSFSVYIKGTGLIGDNTSLGMITSLEGAASYYATLPEGKQYSFKLSGSTTTTNSEATLYIKYEAAGTYNGETESNNSFDTANNISLNKQYDGTVCGDGTYNSGNDTCDYYCFALSSASKVSISFEFYDESNYWNYLYAYLYSEDSNGNTTLLYKDLITSRNSNYGTTFSDLRLPTGNYYIVVTRYMYNYYVPYSLTVSGTEESSSSYEIEKNDITSQANSKNVNTWYTGNVNIYKNNGGSSDIDWFSYSVTEKCYLTMELTTPRDSSGTVTATLYRMESNGSMTGLDTVTSGSNPYISSAKGLYDAGTYYIQMTGNSADWDYSICLTQEEYIPLTGIAIPESAQLSVGGKAYLSATFTPSNASEQGVTWTSSDTSVATVDEYGTVTALKLGQTTITATSSFSDSSDIQASCVVSVVKSVTLSINGAENTSTGITLTWGKVSDASGYYIYRKSETEETSVLIKTISSVSKVSYTDTEVKSSNGVTYTYTVIPFGDSIISSGASKEIVRLTGTKLSSAKNTSKKKATIKWKKTSGVTGYQIQYSTSKTFSKGNKTKLVSGSSKAKVKLSGLKKGKTYYVRIRTYKTVSGKKYYSAWSSKKKVKIKK
ncbi:MAG: Ig-like domain-containing protein [Lachnospiraceae bacterium]|nr:Ig-like domain-containing protein [Lachnospiraceae bacterium]